jgi:hypothetical protein
MVEQTAPAQGYFTGDGGAGQTLTVLAPQGNLNSGESYLRNLVQSIIADDFNNFSKIKTTNWAELEKVLAQTEELVYAENPNIIAAGNITQTQYILTGELTKTGAGYALSLTIMDTKTAQTKASYTGTCSKDQLDKMDGIKAASADLLAKMGVNLTAQGKTALLAVKDNAPEARTDFAKAITAQRNGAEVEAWYYYDTSLKYDSSFAEAASRLNILQADITSGSMGQNVRNDIQWRNQWIARLTEAEQFYSNYMKQTLPYYLIYSTNIKQGSIDYTRETVDISGVTVDLVPDARWFFNAPVQVIDVVSAGLLATGRTKDWNLNWPRNSVVGGSFSGRSDQFSVVVELLNDKGASIGSQTVTLHGGWDTSTRSAFQITPRMRGRLETGFSRVNANLITENLTVRIKSIDGVDAARAARDKGIRILTEADYAQLPEVAAGADSRAIAAESRFTIDESGTITGYKGSGGALIIPPYIYWRPVTGIANGKGYTG